MISKYHHLYSHGFIWGFLDNIDNESLNNLCIESYKKRGHPDKNHIHYEDSIIPLNDEIKKIISQLSDAYYNIFNKRLTLQKKEGRWSHWCQVHYKHECSHIHDHWGAANEGDNPDVSAVYYPKAPENSGDLSLRYKKHEFDRSQWDFTPQESKFIIFDATLQHLVYPNLVDEPRISIAFNMMKTDDGK